MGLWLGVYSYLLTYLLLPSILDLLTRGMLTAQSYQGQRIPEGAGIVILIATGVSLMSTLPFYWPQWEREGLVFLFFLLAIGLLGLLDDSLSQKGIKGLQGHLDYFFREGCLSTGLLKALGGVSTALFVSWLLSGDLYLFFLNSLLLCLSTNALNLLDLRPGRAGKAFLLVMFITLWHSSRAAPLFLLTAVLGSVLAYLPADLQGQAMLGDTGANLLGASLGMAQLWSFSPRLKVTVVLLLIGLHVFCEAFSLSKIIAAIPFLEFLDGIGRSKR